MNPEATQLDPTTMMTMTTTTTTNMLTETAKAEKLMTQGVLPLVDPKVILRMDQDHIPHVDPKVNPHVPDPTPRVGQPQIPDPTPLVGQPQIPDPIRPAALPVGLELLLATNPTLTAAIL